MQKKDDVFCHQHQNQIPEEKKNIYMIYFDNIGILTPDVEKIIGEYVDPDTYCKLITYNPKLYTGKIYLQKN